MNWRPFTSCKFSRTIKDLHSKSGVYFIRASRRYSASDWANVNNLPLNKYFARLGNRQGSRIIAIGQAGDLYVRLNNFYKAASKGNAGVHVAGDRFFKSRSLHKESLSNLTFRCIFLKQSRLVEKNLLIRFFGRHGVLPLLNKTI